MSDEVKAVADRALGLERDLDIEQKRYLHYARGNYWAVQITSWTATIAGVAAATLGLIPLDWVQKWQVGLLAAIATALVSASRQLGFQQKANWHYRKEERLGELKRQLKFETPLPITAESVAIISRAWSAIDKGLTQEWEDMQHEPASAAANNGTKQG